MSELTRYAQMANNTVLVVIECAEDPDGTNGEWVACGDAGPGWHFDGINFTRPAPTPAYTKITKRGFQNRFPKTADGVSTKFSLLSMFMTDDGYASSLGVTGAPLYALRALIITGLNTINASQFVDFAVSDASNFTGLLLQAGIPAVFRLTAAERLAILNPVISEAEAFQ